MQMAEPEVRTRRWLARAGAGLHLLLPGPEGLGRRLCYAALAVPLGAVYAALFAGTVAAAVLSAQVVGLPLLLVALMLARGFGGWERRLARRLLGTEVEDAVAIRRQEGGVVRRLRALVLSSSTWRTFAWLGARVLFTAGVLATGMLASGLAYVLLMYPQELGAERSPVNDLLVLLALPVLGMVALRVLDLQVRLMAVVAPALLGVSAQERVVALRQASRRLAERSSVARDLHDTIGHTLTASLLQAGAARKALTVDPDQPDRAVDPDFARQALAHIEENTRSALAELDRALAVLGDPDRVAELAQPDLSDLEGLVAGLRDAGLPVELRVAVRHEDLPPEVSRLAYRVVQEGTTNVLRHAGLPDTLVEVGEDRGWLTVLVRNGTATRPHAGRPGPGGGRGLQGLRDRVDELGGSLVPRRLDGGFEVLALLPYRDRARG